MIETSSATRESRLLPEHVVSNAIVKLYHDIHPSSETVDDDVLANIRAWSFKQVPLQVETIHDNSVLSLVGEAQRRSFIEMRMATFEATDGGKRVLERDLLATLRAADRQMKRQHEPRCLPSPKQCLVID